jgi:carbamoyltransferase
MYVLGLSCYYHDSCAVLLKDGVVVAAAQEERFNRDKYSPAFPIQAVNYCFQEAGITIYDVDEVAFYEKMFLKFERTMLSHILGYPFTLRNFIDTVPLWLKDRLAVPYYVEEELRFKKPLWFVKHHLSHASSSFFSSPFPRAAFLTVDGVGEYACASWGVAEGNAVTVRKEQHYPHSLGLLYSIVTAYLGYRVFSGEGKVMALAELGEPTYLDQFRRIVDIRDDGSFALNLEYFSFNRGDKMHNRRFEALFGPARQENAALDDRHRAIACSLQRITEEILLKMARHVHKQTGEEFLCLAGGVFLNVTANSRIRNETPFRDVFIQPSAGDAGAALGAAAYVSHTILGVPRAAPLRSCALGGHYTPRQIEVVLRNKRTKYRTIDPASLVDEVADRLAAGKVVGWFQGRMEFGPRALGNRSILAQPGSPDVKERLNLVIKHREPYRPFAASVLREHVEDWFEGIGDSPFMLEVGHLRSDKQGRIPAVTHANQTSRIQTLTREENGIYYDLVAGFYARTGLPMVLNTSFNEDEPIVRTPAEALRCYEESGMDCLVMENLLIER